MDSWLELDWNGNLRAPWPIRPRTKDAATKPTLLQETTVGCLSIRCPQPQSSPYPDQISKRTDTILFPFLLHRHRRHSFCYYRPRLHRHRQDHAPPCSKMNPKLS
ncbi:hypothetical protein EsH8_XII_000049 [Colletotrichum jinshuiense]